MKTSLIILSKVGLGGGGSFGALLFALLVFYFLYRKASYGDSGCLDILLFPLLPFYFLFKGFEKLSLYEPESNTFNLPPSGLLKVIVALSTISLWILMMTLIETYTDSLGYDIFCVVILPILLCFLYVLWVKLFFVWLGRFRPKVAIIICIISILLVIAFTIAAIKLHNYYTSLDFLKQYWAKKYGLTT